MSKIKIDIGEITRIENKTIRRGAPAEYVYVVGKEYIVQVGQCCERPLMLTAREYAIAQARALKNPEDCIDRHTTVLIRPKKREKGFMAWLKRRASD